MVSVIKCETRALSVSSHAKLVSSSPPTLCFDKNHHCQEQKKLEDFVYND